MKKATTLLVAILLSVSINAQTSSGTWDNKTVTYTNSKHNITWKLIEELEWIGRPILTDNTLFKVRNDDTQILVKLNVTPFDGQGGDIWDLISQYQTKEYQDQLKALAQSNGMTLKDTKAQKSQLCGLHANKVKSDMTKYYPDEKITVHSLEYSYQLIKNNNIYTLGITVLSALEDDLEEYDRIVTKLVNGFSIK